MPLRFRENTNTEQLYKIIHYVGAFRHSDLRLFGNGCHTEKEHRTKQSTLQQAERRLRKEEYLKKVRYQKQWYVKRGKKPELDIYKDAREDYKKAIKAYYADGSQKSNQLNRAARLSQSAIVALSVGCKVFPGEKPDLNSGQCEENECVFYAPREITEVISKRELNGVRGSRATGHIICPEGILNMYIASHRDRAITDAPEYRVSLCAVKALDGTRQKKKYDMKVKEAVCMMKTSKVTEWIFEKTKTAKMGEATFTSVYENIYTVPLNFDGERLMRALISDRDSLRNITGEEVRIPVKHIDCDYKTEEDTYILEYFIPDIKRLLRFASAAKSGEQGKYKVCCFDIFENDLDFLTYENISLAIYPFDEWYQWWIS